MNYTIVPQWQIAGIHQRQVHQQWIESPFCCQIIKKAEVLLRSTYCGWKDICPKKKHSRFAGQCTLKMIKIDY